MNTPLAKPVEPVEPWIDLRQVKPGMVFLLETEAYLYEIEVIRPEYGLVKISSTDSCLRQATVGQVSAPLSIRKGVVLEIRFRNGTYQTPPIRAASALGVREDGSRWSYEVF